MMPHVRGTITRRLFTCAALAATLVTWPTPLRGESAGRDDRDAFRRLSARPARVHLRGPDAAPNEVWAYDGTVPGPALRVARGEVVRVGLRNELTEATTLHWHGVRLSNAMDGVPHLTQMPVTPGAGFDYRFSAPDAGTFWYRPLSPEQRDRGLYGALIVAESEPVAVDRDVLLLLSDWRLGPAGASPGPAGGSDEHLTANGQPSLDVPVRANERLRLRLINASRTRPMSLRFDQHRARVMAIDGEPAEPFLARDNRVVFGPGNRLDLFLDMVLAPGSTASAVTAAHGGDIDILRFIYAAGAPARAEPLPEPKPLPANGLPARIEFRNALRPDLRIEAGAPPWTAAAAAAAGRYGAPLFSTKRGRTAVLAAANRGADAVVLHLHGHHARLLDNLDDGWKPFWLDTIMVAARQSVRLAFVADNPGKWLIDCQTLGRRDAGMAAWFEVT